MIPRKAFVHPEVEPLKAILLGVVWIALFLLYGYPKGEVHESYEVFAFNRMAQATTFVAGANDTVPLWTQKALRIHDQALERKLILHYRVAEKWGLFPEKSRSNWAAALVFLGSHDGATEVLDVDFGNNQILSQQKQILRSLTAEEQAPEELLEWSKQRNNDGFSELPEWLLLSRSGETYVEDWMVNNGHRMIGRGLLFDVMAFLAIIGGLIIWIRVAFRGSSFPPGRKQSPILQNWNPWFVLQQLFLIEIITLALVLMLSQFFAVDVISDGEMSLTHFIFLCLPAVYLALRLFPRECASWKTLFRFRNGWDLWTAARLGMLFVFLGLLLCIPFDLLGLYAIGLSDVINYDTLDTQHRVVWMVIAAVILAPLCEEFIMRGCVFGGLLKSMGAWPAALISTGIFTLLHGYSVVGFVVVFLMGLAFCWLYYRSGSLWPGIIGHAIYNFIVVNQNLAWYSLH